MQDKVLFRTSFSGFNKQDVLNYIEDTVDEYEDKFKAIRDELKGAKTALEGKTQLYEELLKKQQEYGTPDDLSDKVSELETALSQYKQKNEQIQIEHSQLEQKYNSLLLISQEENGVLKQSFEHLKQRNSQLEQELEEYRSLKQNIGSVLLKAQKDSDDLVINSKKKCDLEVFKAQKYIQDLSCLFEKYHEQIKIEKVQISNSTFRINNELDSISDYIKNAHEVFDDIMGFLKTPDSTDINN